MSKIRKLAEEIVNVLRFNPELDHDTKVLAVECRLDKLAEDVEDACDEAQKRVEDEKITVDARPFDIPVLAEILIKDQAHRGPAN